MASVRVMPSCECLNAVECNLSCRSAASCAAKRVAVSAWALASDCRARSSTTNMPIRYAATNSASAYSPCLYTAALATAGVFLGTLLAADSETRGRKWFLLGCWSLVAVAFAVGLGRGALHGDGLWRQFLYGGAALAPAAVYLLALIKGRQ